MCILEKPSLFRPSFTQELDEIDKNAKVLQKACVSNM
jgi:hypothetical protein